MSEYQQDHSYEAEYADFDLGEEDLGKFADPYEDPLERKVGQIEGYLVQQSQAQQRQAEEAREQQKEQDWDEFMEANPMLQDERVAEQLAVRVDELAGEVAAREGRPELEAQLKDNPQFAADIWSEYFNDGRGPESPGDGVEPVELSGDSLFMEIHRRGQQSAAGMNRRLWDKG